MWAMLIEMGKNGKVLLLGKDVPIVFYNCFACSYVRKNTFEIDAMLISFKLSDQNPLER